MDYEQLFVESKWNVLKVLAERSLSPLELAHELNTTISNVSQQLRLLEMAGLVQKVKIQNRDKGKPRTLFSIADDYLYLVAVTKSFAKKQLMHLSEYHSMILKVWLLQDADLHYYLERFCYKIEEKFPDVKAIAFDMQNKNLKMYVVVDSLDGKEKKGSFKIVKPRSQTKEIEFHLFNEGESKKKWEGFSDSLYALYDPSDLILKIKRINGGKK